MKKLAIGVVVASGMIVILAAFFTFYAHFALDYSLESLRQALEVSREESPEVGNRVYGATIDSVALEEISRKDADFETVLLLDHAARSIRDAVEQSGYARAGVYLAEVLKKKSPQRNLFLRISDPVFHFIKNLIRFFRNFWTYLGKRLRGIPDTQPLEGTGVLILGEAERMERSWKLGEAEDYYHEFLSRFPDRPEEGFVRIYLAHVLMKMRRLEDASKLLEEVQKEYSGMQEETVATSLLVRLVGIKKRLAHLPELENWIQGQPDRIFSEEGGLELALGYLATYQIEKAQSILLKLSETPDPLLRTKALFYRGWIHKWQGDFDKGKELFQALDKDPQLDEKLTFAVTANLAEIHSEKGEYDQALDRYRALSQKAVASEAWRALSELEMGTIYLFGLGNAELARQHLKWLEEFHPRASSDLKLARDYLSRALERNLLDQGFDELAQGQVESALKIFETHLKEFPQDGVAHSAVASIYRLRDLLDKAFDEAQKGYGLEDDEYTATVLGYVYEKMGELEKAEKYYSLGVQINPSYLYARYNLAWVYLVTGRFKEADELMAKLEKERFGSPVIRAKILNNRGCALWELGQEEGAMARFRVALRVKPDFREAQINAHLTVDQKPVSSRI